MRHERLSRFEKTLAKAMAALDLAEKQFTRYAEHHRAKGDEQKAAVNYGHATMCGVALAELKLSLEPPQ